MQTRRLHAQQALSCLPAAFRETREELEHLDLLHPLVAEELIKTGEIVIVDLKGN
jgi:hypothetical protein